MFYCQDIEVLHENSTIVLNNDKLKQVFEVTHIDVHVQAHSCPSHITWRCYSACTCTLRATCSY